MYRLLKPLLFRLPPEKAHELTMIALDAAASSGLGRRALRALYGAPESGSLEKAGLRFPNRVGLAAGFDKDGKHIRALDCLGFGFVEVGTVTPLPQDGNPQPRLFRLPDDQALINRMGFNNAGAAALAARLKALRERGYGGIIGGNIGKNKNTPNEQAESDYLACFEALHPWVDYFVVNVSSPNTPGLRQLQEREPLRRLLEALQMRNEALAKPRPILLKIAPDLSEAQLDDAVEIVLTAGLTGLAATNTTVSREGLRAPQAALAAMGAGGLSGVPLRQRATEVVRHLRRQLGPQPLIIGVGGVDSREAMLEKIDAGADLVQVYTGMVYQGPAIVKRMLATP